MGQGTTQLGQERVIIVSSDSGGTINRQRPSNGKQQSDAERDQDVQRLESQIARTRAEMGDTIDAIQERLDPDRLKHQLGTQVRQATIGRGQAMGTSAIDRIRENPVPAAMVAVGLGWLFMRKPEDRYNSYRDRYPDVYEPPNRVDRLRGQVEDGIDQMSDRAQVTAADMQARAQMKASEVQAQARQQMFRARGGFEQLLDDNPLAVGAVALAAGAALGLAAPITSKEHELMGPARDRMLDDLQGRAEETAQRARQVADKAAASAREEATSQGLT